LTIAVLISEPFSRARWRKSSGDFFFGIGDSERSKSDGLKSVKRNKREAKRETIERLRRYRGALTC